MIDFMKNLLVFVCLLFLLGKCISAFEHEENPSQKKEVQNTSTNISRNSIESSSETYKEEPKTPHPAPTPSKALMSPVNTNSQIIGSWVDKSNGNTHVIYKENSKYYWKSRYFDGSEGTDELVLIKKNGHNRFYQKDIDCRDEYYTINNGVLSIYDETGNLFQQFN